MSKKIMEMIIHVVLLYVLPIALIVACGFSDDRGIVSVIMSIVLVGIIMDDLENVKV